MAKSRYSGRRRPSGGGRRPYRPGRRRGQQGGATSGAEVSTEQQSAESSIATAVRGETGPVTALELADSISVRDLAEKMGHSPIEIIKVLMGYGIMASINQILDFDTAAIVGEELGVEVKPYQPPVLAESEKEEEAAPKTLRQRLLEGESPDNLQSRPPIVTVLGHVDHGKTTLLDAIRSTDVASGESGGITQHIGAYQVEINDRKITFLDTPGHEAFTAMRARGAQTTDITVLVVAADDGVMPQTREAIGHARAAQVPIMVALNKVDRPESQPERVMQELADLELVSEDWGGDTIIVPVSATLRTGVEELLENILLVADVAGFQANPDRPAMGTVIEGKLDRRLGPTATLLVLNGTLRQGDSLLLGESYGRVRTMFDHRGERVEEALPAMPVVVVGLSNVPTAGDTFEVVESGRAARDMAAQRALERATSDGNGVRQPVTLADLHDQISAGKVRELNLILKADVQGSLEPITDQLTRLGTEDVKVKVLYKGIGTVSESDVTLAAASNAIVIGFQVSQDGAAQQTAEVQRVDVRLYDVIYRLADDIDKALSGLMDPVYEEVVKGHAEVRQVFRVRRGAIAGCNVTDGIIRRDALTRLLRGGKVIHEGRIASLRRFKDDVSEVRENFECGIALEGFNELQEGDIVEAYRNERVG